MFSGIETSIKKWSWKNWLQMANNVYRANLPLLNYLQKLRIRWLLSIKSTIKSQKLLGDSTKQKIDQLTQSSYEQQNHQEDLQSIINWYLSQRVSDTTQDILKKVKQLYQTQNQVQAYILMCQQLVASNNKNKARSLLKRAIKHIQELKKEGITIYVEDEVDLRGKLIVLEAEETLLYREYLNQLNSIYDTFTQYFFDHRITLLNNLSLGIQKSQRKDKFQESITCLNESLDLQYKYMILRDERLYYTYNNLACSYFQNGEHAKSAVLFNKLITEMGKQKQKYEQMLKICQNNFKFYFSNGMK